jgi:hypothetical protein
MTKRRRGILWVLSASFLLTAVVLFVLFRFVLTPPSHAPPRPLYTIGAWEGQVAVFEREQSYPKQVYDMPLSGLPYELRQQVLEGVPAYSEEELSVLLEDYTG